MRTKALLCAAGVIAAGVATSMAQVNSLNVVGYTTTIPGNGNYVCICNPVTNTSLPNTLGNLIGSNMPPNSQVLKWNYALTKFDIFKRVGATSWLPASGATTSMNPGEGVFVTSPTSFTNVFVGDVMQAKTPYTDGGPITNSFRSGFELKANMVPDSGTVSSLGLIVPVASPQNQILKWNVALQKYDIYKKISASSWLPSEPVLNVGEGFFTSLTAPLSWVRNYTVQ